MLLKDKITSFLFACCLSTEMIKFGGVDVDDSGCFLSQERGHGNIAKTLLKKSGKITTYSNCLVPLLSVSLDGKKETVCVCVCVHISGSSTKDLCKFVIEM